MNFKFINFSWIKRQLTELTPLWISSFLKAVFNLIFSILIINNSTPNVYASYLIGLGFYSLAGQLADSGVSSCAAMLVTTQKNSKQRFDLYRKIAFTTLKKTSIACLIFLLPLVVGYIAKKSLESNDIICILLFFLLGFISNIATTNSCFIYSTGRFRIFAKATTMPSFLRLVSTGFILLKTGFLSFNSLMFLHVIFTLFEYIFAKNYLKTVLKDMDIGIFKEKADEIKLKLYEMLKPSILCRYFDSLAYNSTLIGSSVFAGNVSIASFGVFQKLLQIFSLVISPIIDFGTRKLRLKNENKTRNEFVILSGANASYLVFFSSMFCVYYFCGKFFSHYSLNNNLAFAIFLFANYIGFLTKIIDSFLFARTQTQHRVAGSLLKLITTSLVILFLKPESVYQVSLVSLLSLIPPLIVYLVTWLQLLYKQKKISLT